MTDFKHCPKGIGLRTVTCFDEKRDRIFDLIAAEQRIFWQAGVVADALPIDCDTFGIKGFVDASLDDG
jgi:hypothetical protein